MRWLVQASGGLSLACCAYGPDTVVQSDTAIEIAASPQRRQAAEDIATGHCRQRGLVPRLTATTGTKEGSLAADLLLYPGVSAMPIYRYECVTPPTP